MNLPFVKVDKIEILFYINIEYTHSTNNKHRMINTIPIYLIFAGDTYYPAEGMRNLYGTAATLDDAIVIGKEAIEVGSKLGGRWNGSNDLQPMEQPESFVGSPCDWMHIVDLRTMKIIAETDHAKTIKWRYTFNTIHEAVTFVLNLYGIKSRDDLDSWCHGKRRNRIYQMVQEVAPDAWTRTAVPKARVRWAYEERLEGYALHR